VGNPRWEVNLLKVKNGEGGKFLIEWAEHKFAPLQAQPQENTIPEERGLIA
jgi:protein ImuA